MEHWRQALGIGAQDLGQPGSDGAILVRDGFGSNPTEVGLHQDVEGPIVIIGRRGAGDQPRKALTFDGVDLDDEANAATRIFDRTPSLNGLYVQ